MHGSRGIATKQVRYILDSAENWRGGNRPGPFLNLR